MAKRSANPRWDHHDSLLDAKGAGTLDLHGLNRIQAEASVRSYLQASARSLSGKVVHIVTGKGKGSATGPVLKPAVRRVLRAAGPLVADYDEDVDGGGFLVKLR